MARPRGLRLNPAALDLAIKRHRNGPLNRTAVAAAAGISVSYLSELCSGATRASLPKAEALALAADADLGALFPEVLRDGKEQPVFREAVAS